MKIVARLLILFFPIFLLSCDTPWCERDFSDRVLQYYKNQLSDEYGSMHEYAVRSPKVQDYLVQLTEITPFGWDTLIWVSDSLKSEDISKLVGTRYEEKDTYKGMRKLIFMNGGKVADIYALRAQDNITFIPGDVQNGYAKVPRDTWFTVRASDTAFTLKRFGVYNIFFSGMSTTKKNSYFKLKENYYTLHISSDTVESKREWYRGNIDIDLLPLGRKLAKEVFTEEQLLQIHDNNIFIVVYFAFYYDTGEIFDCYWNIDKQSENTVSDEQWGMLSEILLKMRVDPRLLEQPQKRLEYPEGKRIFGDCTINITSSLRNYL
ncbi:hypothetical protein [Coprobacter sp.]